MTGSQGLYSYHKPYKDIEEQLTLLADRGMLISDRAAAQGCLERIGYYRLSGYWYPFRKSHLSVNPVTGDLLLNLGNGRPSRIVEDDFVVGTTFQQVMELYVFDKRLRLLFLDALERVEIALRVDVALMLGARSPWAHREPEHLHGHFATKFETGGTTSRHQNWLKRLDQMFSRSNDEFVKHFKRKYFDKPPIWIAIEMWDFGMLSELLGGLKRADQIQLATKYQLPRPELLTTWVRNLNHIRNVCAHHARLWNRSPTDQIAPPRMGEVPSLDHLSGNRHATARIYASAAVLQYLLRKVNPASSWASRLQAHCETFPSCPEINLGQAGFPSEWRFLSLWSLP